MASIQSEILSKVIKGVKPILTGMHLQQQRAGQAMLSRVKSVPKGIEIVYEGGCPVNAEWILPKGAPKDRVMLYMHGGSYRTGDLVASRGLVTYLAKAAGVKALSFEYRLSPEHQFPDSLKDALAAYRFLLSQGYKSEHIGFIGDSAGGGLLMATALYLHNHSQPQPGCLMCISPWVDLTETSESHQRARDKDPLVDSDYLLQAALDYSGEESLLNPYISPAFAEYTSDFPPTLIHVGTKEVLYDDAVTLHQKLTRGGAEAYLEVFEGMWHVWHIFNVPESNEALEKIGAYMREKLQVSADAGDEK